MQSFSLHGLPIVVSLLAREKSMTEPASCGLKSDVKSEEKVSLSDVTPIGFGQGSSSYFISASRKILRKCLTAFLGDNMRMPSPKLRKAL